VIFKVVTTSILSLMMLGVGVTEPEKSLAGNDEQTRSHWSYLGIEGPAHWGMLTQEYMTCQSGSKQSPI